MQTSYSGIQSAQKAAIPELREWITTGAAFRINTGHMNRKSARQYDKSDVILPGIEDQGALS